MTIAHAEGLAAKLRSGRMLLGGHRGNPDEFPENTLASFRSAIELGVDMIECDVHLSSDGELVVIHDHTLDRTTNGTGLVSTQIGSGSQGRGVVIQPADGKIVVAGYSSNGSTDSFTLVR